MITFLMIILMFGLMVWMMVKVYKSASWHHLGAGERKAKAEFARIKREEPDSGNAKISEAEFVETYVSAFPGALRYVLFTFLIMFVGMPASCVMGGVETMNMMN